MDGTRKKTYIKINLIKKNQESWLSILGLGLNYWPNYIKDNMNLPYNTDIIGIINIEGKENKLLGYNMGKLEIF